MKERRKWKIETPPPPSEGMTGKVFQEHLHLSESWMAELVRRRTFTAEEAAALRDPDSIASWAPVGSLFGPLPTVARVDDRLIAGVDLWQQQRDRYWFVSDLVRDQAPEFKGVGRDIVDAALDWWKVYFASSGYRLRAFALERDFGAVEWWTEYVGAGPTISGETIRSRGYEFAAVGWSLAASP